MQHTDILLGKRPKSLTETEAEMKRAMEQERAAAQTNLMHLQALVQQPGWAIFKAYCQQEHLLLMERLERAIDPTTLAKLVGVNLAVESFPEWPERQMAELAALIKESP